MCYLVWDMLLASLLRRKDHTSPYKPNKISSKCSSRMSEHVFGFGCILWSRSVNTTCRRVQGTETLPRSVISKPQTLYISFYFFRLVWESINVFLQEAASLLRFAWAESPELAIQLASRFPSVKLKNDLRWLVLNFPEKVIEEPGCLEIMLGATLPTDVSVQLKVSRSQSPLASSPCLNADWNSTCCIGLLWTLPRP